MLQGLPPQQQDALITGVVHSLTTYREELNQIHRSDDQPGPSTASSSAPLDQLPAVDPPNTGTGLYTFLYPIPDLCH